MEYKEGYGDESWKVVVSRVLLNFSYRQLQHLLELVYKYRGVFENKTEWKE